MIPDDETAELQELYQRISDDLYSTSSSRNRIKSKNNGVLKSTDVSVNANKRSWRYFKQDLRWSNIIAIFILHFLCIYALCTVRLFDHLGLIFWGYVTAVLASFGVGAGAHRLWTHRCYKAKLPLRIMLLCFYCSAGMNSIYNWVRDHRVHHKYTETDADPHNSDRGFFFSHVGWLMMKKHPEVLEKGRKIDMSDILEDPVLVFGNKYFIPLKILFCYVIPFVIPVYFWNENYLESFYTVLVRYAFILNATWSVNSFAHIFGSRPYDKMIAPVENAYVSFFTSGEGWHNYHHVVPWDYKASELGFHFTDLSTLFINFFAKIGWAYDLKEPSQELIKFMITKKGDGSHTMLAADKTKDIK